MSSINLYDKFFHSPNWKPTSNEGPLERFRDILKSGYILSREKLGLPPRYPYPCRTDRVYLSVHPNGEFYHMHRGISIDDEDTAYEMTIKGLYFILSAKLMEDDKIEPGIYDGECTVPDQIELYRYLVGIGNAGYTIDDNLVLCFNLIKYFNGEIAESELISAIKERSFNCDISNRIRGLINSFFSPSYETLPKMTARKARSYVNAGYYHGILGILDEVGKSIPLYDKYGYSIDPNKLLVAANDMHKYIGANLDIAERAGMREAMIDLVDRFSK